MGAGRLGIRLERRRAGAAAGNHLSLENMMTDDNDNDNAQAVAAASTTWVEELLRTERERASTRLLTEGMPKSQVAQLLQAAAALHAGQLAQVARDVAGALGQGPLIH